MDEAPLCLGVAHSLTGAKWLNLSAQDNRMAQQLGQTHRYPPALANVLARLGVMPEDCEAYLDPKLRDLMPNPNGLRDMGAAVQRLNAAIAQKQRIAVFADYDVDGATSGALLYDYLLSLGISVTIYIPDRQGEGYGPNTPAMQRLGQEHDLIICVDCGTLSYEPIAQAGCDVIVMDHHQGGETLPDAVAVVNPNRQDETGDLGYLCAAGVVFFVLVALNGLRRDTGQDTPDLLPLLDLVALGTVADVAPLCGINRAFVRQGLKIMAQRQRIGLRALCDQAQLNTAPTSYHLGYVLGPRINAGGRVGRADLGLRLLTCRNADEASALAKRLDDLNTQRKEIEAEVQSYALIQAETRGLEQPFIWAAGENWHPGVLGIVAARLKARTNRPSLVMGIEGDLVKGSARSVRGIDMGRAIAQLCHEGFITQGGGHAMAAGLSLLKDQIDPAMARLQDLLCRQGADCIAQKELRIDAVLSPRAATPDLLEQLERAGPFGASAPAPRVAFPDLKVKFSKRIGENHLMVTLSDDHGAKLDGIAFGAFDSALGQVMPKHDGQRFHIAGQLEIDHWGGGPKVKRRIEDAGVA